jgi:hypothetical protein
MQYNLVGYDGGQNITVVAGGEMYVADSTHPSFDAIVQGAIAGDESVVDLFDVAQTIAATVADEALSERLRAANGRITYDHDPLNEALENTILRYLQEGDRDNLAPLVGFVERVMTNPVEHSRDQSFAWLSNQSFSLTDEGNVLGYKGFHVLDDGTYASWHSGDAIVNGERQASPVYNIGDVVELPRSEVVHDPNASCSRGLHVGTKSYSRQYGKAQLLVEVDPRDIVSVPNGEGEKMRVSRYRIVADVTDEQEARPIRDSATPVCSECNEACEYPI